VFAGEDWGGFGLLNRWGGIEDRLFGEVGDDGRTSWKTCLRRRYNIHIALPKANSLWRVRRVDNVIFRFLGNVGWEDWF